MYTAAPRGELSQGDIFSDVPIEEVSGDHRRRWSGRVIVLSHDCEIDKPGCQAPLVVCVRENHEFPPDKWDLIRQNRLYNGMHLEGRDDLQEGFVDFRFIHRVRREVLEERQKAASLDDETRLALTAFLWRFFTRQEPTRERQEGQGDTGAAGIEES